jgi:hypothetical protein
MATIKDPEETNLVSVDPKGFMETMNAAPSDFHFAQNHRLE